MEHVAAKANYILGGTGVNIQSHRRNSRVTIDRLLNLAWPIMGFGGSDCYQQQRKLALWTWPHPAQSPSEPICGSDKMRRSRLLVFVADNRVPIPRVDSKINIFLQLLTKNVLLWSISASCLQQHSDTSGSNSTEQTSRDSWSNSSASGGGRRVVGVVRAVSGVSSRHSRGSGQSKDDSLELHCNE